MDEVRGKPAPDVYLTAAAGRQIGVAAVSCLALEDSPHGIASAKAAGMRCMALPDPSWRPIPATARPTWSWSH